jgi:hypothetical protein
LVTNEAHYIKENYYQIFVNTYAKFLPIMTNLSSNTGKWQYNHYINRMKEKLFELFKKWGSAFYKIQYPFKMKALSKLWLARKLPEPVKESTANIITIVEKLKTFFPVFGISRLTSTTIYNQDFASGCSQCYKIRKIRINKLWRLIEL